MLIQEVGEKAQLVNVNEVVDFHVDSSNTQHIVYMMINMYKDPVLAVIRELVANAADEHAKHNIARKFMVCMPTSLNMTFTVRDYAKGLSEFEVYKLITGIGSSGDYKRQDVHTTGGFGIGAKCPATIADQWTITSHHEGEKTVYSAFKDSKGQLKLAKLGSSPTEESGLEVCVPVKASLINTFKSKLPRVLAGFTQDEVPELVNVSGDVYPFKEIILENENWLIPEHTVSDVCTGVILNRVLYPVDLHTVLRNKSKDHLHNNVGFILKFNNTQDKKCVSVTPSREGLIYTEELNNLLCNKLQQAYDESLALIQAKINKAANLFEAYKIIKPLRNYRFNSLIGSGDEFKFKFRNVQMSKLALLDMEPVITDPRVIEAVSSKDTSQPKHIGCYMHTKDGANDRTSVKKYLFHRGTDLSLDEATIWCINDLPDVNVERIPVRYVDHLHRYGAAAPSGIKLSGTKRTIIVINNNKVVLDVMEEKFPGIKDSFMCKFSDLEKWCPKPPVVKRDPQNKIAKVKVEKTQDNGNEHIINKSHARVADFLTEEGITVGYATAQNNVVYMPISNLTDMQGRRVVRDKHQYFTSALRHILTLPVIRDVIKPYKIYGIKEANLEEILGVIKPEQKWVTIGDFLKMLPNLIKNSGNKAFNEFIEFLCTCHLLHSQLCEFPKLKGATYDQIRKDQHVYQVLDWLDIVLAESAELPKQSKLLRAISAMRELINPEYIKSFTAEHSTISRIYDVMETNAHDWLGVPKETIQHSKQTNKFMDMFSDAWLNSDAFKALCYINGDYVLTQNYSFQRGGGDHRKNLIRLLIPQL